MVKERLSKMIILSQRSEERKWATQIELEIKFTGRGESSFRQ